MNRVFQFKLVLLGQAGVGKSNLVLRFVKGEFLENNESTIGAAFLTQTVALSDGSMVKFEIWDTAGQERFNSLAPMYYRGAQAALVVYDITNENSFARAKTWVRELEGQGGKMVIALVGNKSDLETIRRVSTADGQSYAEEKNLLFMETSAKTAQNVSEIFEQIAKTLPKPQNRSGTTSNAGLGSSSSGGSTVPLGEDSQTNTNKDKKCCS
eukprot:TRINITY_DN14698_c0_g1_i1.p1 TRINITY_DN14698_c0_g1~~TRINITY_DN14698_c0_g1_i1.p1  ORF type:complete len:211 (-),score=39.52 TRINITY_DN14698_c0_g1_i1:130-762(-)